MGKQCTFAGHGKAYDEFMKTGVLQGFTGYGQKPTSCKDPHFNEVQLRYMTFAQTYGKEKYKESELCFKYILMYR